MFQSHWERVKTFLCSTTTVLFVEIQCLGLQFLLFLCTRSSRKSVTLCFNIRDATPTHPFFGLMGGCTHFLAISTACPTKNFFNKSGKLLSAASILQM